MYLGNVTSSVNFPSAYRAHAGVARGTSTDISSALNAARFKQRYLVFKRRVELLKPRLDRIEKALHSRATLNGYDDNELNAYLGELGFLKKAFKGLTKLAVSPTLLAKKALSGGGSPEKAVAKIEGKISKLESKIASTTKPKKLAKLQKKLSKQQAKLAKYGPVTAVMPTPPPPTTTSPPAPTPTPMTAAPPVVNVTVPSDYPPPPQIVQVPSGAASGFVPEYTAPVEPAEDVKAEKNWLIPAVIGAGALMFIVMTKKGRR